MDDGCQFWGLDSDAPSGLRQLRKSFMVFVLRERTGVRAECRHRRLPARSQQMIWPAFTEDPSSEERTFAGNANRRRLIEQSWGQDIMT